MPISNPTERATFNEQYARLGRYVTDDSRIPYFNPADSGVMIQDGEPVLLNEAGGTRVYLAQGNIRPGEIGYLNKRFTVDLPCDFSADTAERTLVYWDVDDSQVKLAGDVTNGFTVGQLSWPLPTDRASVTPSVDADGKVVAVLTTDTNCRVISENDLATTKGTVTPLNGDAIVV